MGAVDEVQQHYDAAHFHEIDPYVASRLLPESARPIAEEMNAAYRLVEEAAGFQPASIPPAAGRPRLMTVLHSCLPWLPGGYSGRAHGLMEYLSTTSAVSLPVTRTGFLGDMKRGLSAVAHPHDVVGSVIYQHVDSPRPRANGEYQYMEASIPVYEQIMKTFGPTHVHLRSSYPSALPALIAAKRLNIPVIYEVSGLWELVFAGRGESALAARAKRMEQATMSAADQVVTLTRAMRKLIERDYLHETSPGVRLAPNAVDIDAFRPSTVRSSTETVTIGYVGSLLDYEGIDVLLEAMRLLKDRSVPIRGLIVGGGPELENVRKLRTQLGLEETVELTGQVAPEDVVKYYDEIDLCPFPRHSTPATEAVSPLKPFEAMAMGIPVIVSNVEALVEIVENSNAGMVFSAGDSTDLANAIESMIDDRSAMREFGESGRSFVELQHTWSAVGQAVLSDVFDRE